MNQNQTKCCFTCPHRTQGKLKPIRKYLVEFKDRSRHDIAIAASTFDSCSVDPIEIGNEFLSIFRRPQDISLIRIHGGLTLAESIRMDEPEDVIAFFSGRIKIPRSPVDHYF